MINYYDSKSLLNKNGDINVIWGPTMIGKTYTYLKLVLENFRNNKRTFLYVKRWNEDVNSMHMKRLIDQSLVENVFGKGYTITFFRGKFILNYEDKKEVIGYAVAINNQAHIRACNYDNIQIIILDDFLQVKSEKSIPYEFDCWEAILSSIKVSDIKVFILGNTVTKYSPYFEMYKINLNNIKPGEIKIINDKSPCIVAQWCKLR